MTRIVAEAKWRKMFSSPILDVAVGLVLIYLILALACTSINEYIAQLLSLRAQMLQDALRGLFQNSPQSKSFVQSLYDHDLIDALSPPKEGALPSYIPAHIFSLALVDRLGFHDVPVVAGANPPSVSDLLDASPVGASIKRVLKPFAAGVGSDLDRFRLNVESWFDESMQRVGGWYKRRIAAITLIVAMLICLVANADTLMIADNLWSNPTVRAQLADAGKLVTPAKLTPPTAPPVGSARPGALATTNPPSAGSGSAPASPPPAPDPSSLKQAESIAGGLMGWSGPILPWLHGYDRTNTHRFPDGWEWIWKLIGIGITAIAVSLGAPFWFDTLNRIMSIRNAGASPSDPGCALTRIPSLPASTAGSPGPLTVGGETAK